jgi:hypothetical protein
MNGKIRALLGVLTALSLLLGAYALGMTRQRLTPAQNHLVTASAMPQPPPAPVMTPVAARAFADLQALARRDFSALRLQPDSFRGTDQWSGHHMLHWVTFEYEGREVRLYHLTDKKHPEHRHTATWSPNEAYPTHWEPVQ